MKDTKPIDSTSFIGICKSHIENVCKLRYGEDVAWCDMRLLSYGGCEGNHIGIFKVTSMPEKLFVFTMDSSDGILNEVAYNREKYGKVSSSDV